MILDHITLDEEACEEKTGMPFVKLNGYYEWGVENIVLTDTDVDLLRSSFNLEYKGLYTSTLVSYYRWEASHLHIHVYTPIYYTKPFMMLNISLFSTYHEILQLVLKGIRCCKKTHEDEKEYNYACDDYDLLP
jgi:hypothetical protein